MDLLDKEKRVMHVLTVAIVSVRSEKDNNFCNVKELHKVEPKKDLVICRHNALQDFFYPETSKRGGGHEQRNIWTD